MTLKPIKSNMSEIKVGNVTVLFSYQTPVACLLTNGSVYEYYQTAKKWSRTTSRHISQWLEGNPAMFKDQEYFDNLLSGVK